MCAYKSYDKKTHSGENWNDKPTPFSDAWETDTYKASKGQKMDEKLCRRMCINEWHCNGV